MLHSGSVRSDPCPAGTPGKVRCGRRSRGSPSAPRGTGQKPWVARPEGSLLTDEWVGR